MEGPAMTCAAAEKCAEERDLCFDACGDGVLDEGEACDDGGPSDERTAECELPVEEDAGIPDLDGKPGSDDTAVAAEGGTEPDDSGDGCSCRVASARQGSSRAPWALGALGLALVLRRRRR